MGVYYLTMIGVRVLEKPTQAPWMILPISNAGILWISTSKPAKKATAFPTKKHYLLLSLGMMNWDPKAPNKAPNEMQPERRPWPNLVSIVTWKMR